VIGGCLDAEFESVSRRLLERFRKRRETLVLSDLTLLELEEAPSDVRAILDGIPDESKEYVELSSEAAELAEEYIKAGVLGEGKRVDAQHIAIPTVARVDVLVSWNFQHIVNIQRIRGYNSVNLRAGYPILEIRSPQEVIDYAKEE
jgi:hypothetical protein